MAFGSGTGAQSRSAGILPSLPGRVDVALLSLGTTLGLRHADEALAELLAAAGLSCRIVRVRFGATARLRRQITVIDLVEGLAARRAARGTHAARAVIVSSATTALLLERPQVPWAVRFDSPTALNRPGWSGAWQRARERRVLPAADVLLPYGRAAADAVAPLLHPGRPRVIPLPVPIAAPGAAGPPRPEVVAYAGWMWKRGIDILCAAWNEAAPDGARLTIGGADRAAGRAWLERCGVPEPASVEWVSLPHREWLDRVARATAFVNASRREDYGQAQLEALAAGTPLVTVPSPGAYEALPIARRLAPELVAADVTPSALVPALRAGLELRDREGYARQAAAEMAPYRRDAVLAVVRNELAPALRLG
jgi:glycosyltransferase involved in cell wall biosynthesis